MFPLGSAHLPNSQGSCSLHQNSCLVLDQDPTLYQILCPPISFPKLEAVSSQHQNTRAHLPGHWFVVSQHPLETDQ